MRVRQCSCPTSATVYGPKAVFQLVQLTVAIVSKMSSRCKPELLPVTSEQSMAMPGGINCNYTIPHLRSFFLCSAAALQSVLPQCPTSITAGGGSSSVPLSAAVISALLGVSWCLTVVQSWGRTWIGAARPMLPAQLWPFCRGTGVVDQYRQSSIYHFLLYDAEVRAYKWLLVSFSHAKVKRILL